MSPDEIAARESTKFLALLRQQRDELEAEIAEKQEILRLLNNLIHSYER